MGKKTIRILALVFAFVILFASSSELLAISFNDAKDSWAKDYISWCSDRGIINGYTDATFKPDNKITKAEFASMLAKTISKEAPAIVDLKFEDVKTNDWFYAAVRKLVAFDIAANEKNFYPNQLITRELAVKWLAATIAFNADTSLLNAFVDANKVINKDAFAKLIELEIVGGYTDKTLRAKNFITRAEAAKLFYTYINKAVDKGLLVDKLKLDSNAEITNKEEGKAEYPYVPYRPRKDRNNDNKNHDYDHGDHNHGDEEDTKPVVPKKRFTLNIKSTDDYTVEISPQSPDGKYEEGQIIELRITINNDKKELKQVLLNGENISSLNGVYSFKMPSKDTSLEVVLEKKAIEEKDDIEVDFNNNEEVEINRNSQLVFNATANDEDVKEINLRLNREADEHLIYLNSYPFDNTSVREKLVKFVVPDYLEPGRYILSAKSGRPESKMQRKVIVVKDNFDKIVSIDPIADIVVTQGDDIQIPGFTKATYSDNSTRVVKINWNLPENFENPGEYLIEGRVEGYDSHVNLKIIVKKRRAKLVSIVPIKDINIVKGTKIELPKYVKVNMDDGSKEDRTAHWNEINFNSDEPGTHKVEGYILADEADINSKKLPISIKIIIKDSEPFEAHFALLQKPNYYPFQKDAMLGLEKATGNEYAPSNGDYALVITLKDEKSVINSVEIMSEDPSLDIMARPVGKTFPIDKRAFFMRNVSPIKTKIIAKITIDGEQYTKSVDFVAGPDFKKEAVTIKDDLKFKFPQGTLNLPENVKALYNDGSEAKSNVTWDKTTVDVNIPGTYDVKGTLASGLVVNAKVEIYEHKDVKLNFSETGGTVTVKQSEYIMPDKELTLSVSGVASKDVRSIEIKSDNPNAVKIEDYDKNFDGSDIKIKAKAVGVGKANIVCKITLASGQEDIQKLMVVVKPIRDFKADEFAIIAKDAGPYTTKVRIIYKYSDLDLYAKSSDLGMYYQQKVNASTYVDAYEDYRRIGKTIKLEVYYESKLQAILDGVKVIKEGDPLPWEESTPEFKAEDFSLTYEDSGWGGMLKLNCTNANASKIVAFALYDSSNNSAFYDEEFVSYQDGGYLAAAPAKGTEYTLKVFADKNGQTKLYEGKIKYGSEETNDGFKAEDFKLTYEDTGWGGYNVYLECTNERKDEIKAFAVKDSEDKSIFDNEVANMEEGGFMYSAPADGTEYTLKVFSDDKGQELLYEGPIKFTK